MSKVAITREPGLKIKSVTPYAKEFVSAAKDLGGKWDGTGWVFDARNEGDVRALCIRVYGTDGSAPVETVDLRIVVTASDTVSLRKSHPFDEDGLFVTMKGRQIARAFGRDSGAKLADGVVVRKGGFKSGGSMRNPTCVFKRDTDLEIEVYDFPKSLADEVLAEYPEVVSVIQREPAPAAEPVVEAKPTFADITSRFFDVDGVSTHLDDQGGAAENSVIASELKEGWAYSVSIEERGFRTQLCYFRDGFTGVILVLPNGTWSYRVSRKDSELPSGEGWTRTETFKEALLGFQAARDALLAETTTGAEADEPMPTPEEVREGGKAFAGEVLAAKDPVAVAAAKLAEMPDVYELRINFWMGLYEGCCMHYPMTGMKLLGLKPKAPENDGPGIDRDAHENRMPFD